MVSDDGKPNGLFMLWQAPLTDEDIDDVLKRIGRIDELFDRHPYALWLTSGLEADFRAAAVAYALRMAGEGRARDCTRFADDAFTDALNWD